MINYSFSSIYMAFFASNLLIIILALCFKSIKLTVNVGYKLLLLFVYCTLLRFIFPIELPLSTNILMCKSFSYIISRIRHPLFTIAGFQCTIWTILLAIWIIGFLIQFIKFIFIRKRARSMIFSSCLDITETEPYQTVLSKVYKEQGKHTHFRILEVYGITSPMLYGAFKPHILVPVNWDVSETELWYIISHEVSHHYHHDLLTKNLIHFLCIIYWWNPCCHLLRQQADLILEMRIDNNVTKSDCKAISDYLQCLINIATYKVKMQENCIANSLTLSFAKIDETEMRFEMLTQSHKPKKLIWNIALVVLVFGIYILSYVFIFEAHYISPQTEESTIEPTAETTYAIQNEDGTYSIYYNDILIETTDSLEYYSSEIPIYIKEKENYNEKN